MTSHETPPDSDDNRDDATDPAAAFFEDTNALYRALVDRVEDYAIFALDHAGFVRSWNAGAQRAKGYTAEEIIGQHYSVFYEPADREAGKPTRLLETARTVGKIEDEGWRLRKDGTRFWASVVLTALRTDSNKVAGFAKVTRDLTVRREAQEQAIRLAAEQAALSAAAEKTRELEVLAEQLKDQAVELEAQMEEAQSLTEELEQSSHVLQSALAETEESREAAEHAERYTRGILESISDPFVVLDADWRYQYMNEPAANMMSPSRHMPPEALIGKRMWDLYPDILGTDFDRNMRLAATQRRPVTFEAFYPPRGEWSQLTCFPLPDGGIAVQWRDISARRRAEEAAHILGRASDIMASSLDFETTLRDVAQVMVPQLADWCSVDLIAEDGTLQQLAVAHVDPGKVRWARELNERYPRSLEADTGVPNVIRTGQPELVPEITDDMLAASTSDEEHLMRIRELGLRSVMTVPLVTPERILGAITFVSAESGRRYTEADLELATELGRRAGIAVENARLHREALAARAAAEEANLAKTQFLATMSHELRTPLNAIGGYVELLRMGLQGPVSEKQDDYLARVQRSQQHLLSLINDILNFAKLQSGQVRYEITDVAVQAVLDEMDTLIAPQVQQAKLLLRVVPSSTPLFVRADAERLRQVLLNLLSNAVKFTPSGGEITIRCAADGNNVAIAVQDSGVGIAPAKQETIFAPFVQLGHGLSEHLGGTGLGLSISRDLARAMGGDLHVRSALGHGSTFLLTLPRA